MTPATPLKFKGPSSLQRWWKRPHGRSVLDCLTYDSSQRICEVRYR